MCVCVCAFVLCCSEVVPVPVQSSNVSFQRNGKASVFFRTRKFFDPVVQEIFVMTHFVGSIQGLRHISELSQLSLGVRF